MNVLFMGAMSLRFLGLVLFFQLFKPGFVFWGGLLLVIFLFVWGSFFVKFFGFGGEGGKLGYVLFLFKRWEFETLEVLILIC